MKKTIRLTEADLTRIVNKVIKEQENTDGESNDQKMNRSIMTVLDFAYEQIEELAPDGPGNKEQYLLGINQLEKEFNFAIRNLKGNIGA
jgi:hypothetical protein